MEQQSEQIAKEVQITVAELLDKMGFSCELEIITINTDEDPEVSQEDMICNIKTKESNFLIGQYGVNLQALQHIARVIVRNKTENKINFILDVNNYRKEKRVSIMILAKNIAEQVISEKRAIVLRPMSAYERRLVHIELSKNSGITTESTGEGEDRKVIVKPVIAS